MKTLSLLHSNPIAHCIKPRNQIFYAEPKACCLPAHPTRSLTSKSHRVSRQDCRDGISGVFYCSFFSSFTTVLQVSTEHSRYAPSFLEYFLYISPPQTVHLSFTGSYQLTKLQSGYLEQP